MDGDREQRMWNDVDRRKYTRHDDDDSTMRTMSIDMRLQSPILSALHLSLSLSIGHPIH